MKSIKVSSLLTLVLSVAIFASCTNPTLNDRDEPSAEQLDDNLFKDPDGARIALAGREHAEPEKSFFIKNITCSSNKLSIVVLSANPADSFSLLWDGTVMLSYPMQIRLVLVTEGASSGHVSEKTIDVDITKVFGHSINCEEAIFNVLNGSALQDVRLNSDGSVSNIGN